MAWKGGSNKIGWMGFFMLAILVLAFAFIIIEINSQNAAAARRRADENTSTPEYSAYSNETARQAGIFDVQFMRIVFIVMVVVLPILVGIGMLVRSFVKRGKGKGGMM